MQDGLTISNLPEGHNLTVSRVEINVPAPAVTPGSSLVKVRIKYPDDWKRDKFFKDGDIKEVSPETAATFVEIGIATIVNSNTDETDEDPDVEFNREDGKELSLETGSHDVAPKKGGKKTAGK